MRTFERIGYLLGVFGVAVGTIYGLWTNAVMPDGVEYAGFLALLLVGIMGFGLSFALRVNSRKLPPAPEDDLLGEIDDISGDYGFFSPHSWQPLFLAGSAAIMFLGLAVGWWLFIIGGILAVPAVIGWTFEYWRGPHTP